MMAGLCLHAAAQLYPGTTWSLPTVLIHTSELLNYGPSLYPLHAGAWVDYLLPVKGIRETLATTTLP